MAQIRGLRTAELTEVELRDLLDNAQVLVQSVDREGRLRYVNRLWRETLHYTEVEVLGRHLLEIVHPSQREHCAAVFQELMRSGGPATFETVFLTRDGRPVEVAGSVSTRWEGDSPVATRGVFIDLTARNRSEQSLRASEARYRTLFAATSDAVLLVDQYGRIFDCNPAALRLFAAPDREEMIGRGLADLSPRRQPGGEESAAAISARFQAMVRAGASRFEWLHRRCDQSEFPAEVLLGSMEIAGRWVGQAVVRNISDRKREEQRREELRQELARRVEEATAKLRDANQALRREVRERVRAEKHAQRAYQEQDQIFQNSASGMRVIDVDFNVVRANDTLTEIIGLSKARIIGHKCWESFPGDECDTDACTLRRVMRGESIRDFEVQRSAAEDRRISCLLNVRELRDERGRLVGIVEDYRDLTETKRLQSIAEAVNTMNSIGYVFSGIRHELGNPINALKTTLSVLKLKLDTFDEHTVAEYLDRTLSDVSRVEYLLRSLKSFSLFERPVIQSVNLSAFLNNLSSLVEKDLGDRGISVVFEACPPERQVQTDPRALQQVMLNLITNAADALRGRSAPRVVISTAARGRLVEIVTEDNGCGFSAAGLSDLFKPFHTTKAGGTGLGLVIVKKMLSQMDGTIDVYSLPDRGARVTVVLPGSG